MDDLADNGGNMMIEVMRQAFHDLGTLLATYEPVIVDPSRKKISYKMPKKLFLQFDSSGVNKVSVND